MTKRVLATVIVLAFAIGSAAIVAPLFFLRPEAKQASTLASTSMSTPVRMRIPAIGVDAPIRPVAADAAGGLTIPVDPSWIAWYSPGVRPGEAGDAVLAGRLDASGNSALARLAQLPTGSPIEVLLADGSTLTFDVASAQGYAGNRQPAGLFGRGGLPRISLVASGTARFVVEATLRRIAVPLPSGRFEQH